VDIPNRSTLENGDVFGFGCESKEDNWTTDAILFSRSAAQGRLGDSLVGCGRPRGVKSLAKLASPGLQPQVWFAPPRTGFSN
jgi:hypothetical protein